jgi:heme/copper-type cytochrome/quinol oxidase subunit 2
MLQLFIQLNTALLRFRLSAEHRLAPSRSEDGSVTTEHVLWAVAVIAIVGIVVAAVKAYVTLQAGNLK